MGISIEITADSNFADIARRVHAGAQQGVALAGERLLALSSVEVPHDVGTLSQSGAVSTPLASQSADPVAEVTYDTPYAARLHEHPEYNFQKGRKGKYVEDPAMSNKDELGDIIRKQITDA